MRNTVLGTTIGKLVLPVFFLVFSSLQKSFSSADRDATGLKLIVCTYAKMRCRKVESI